MALNRANSLQAEKAILGTMLGDPNKVSHCVAILVEEDFYNESYRKIFAIMRDLFNARQAVDITSVTDKLNDLGILDDVGGVGGLVELTETVTVENVSYYIDILKDKTNLRKLADFLEETYTNFDGKSTDDIHSYLSRLEEDMLKITRFRSVSDFQKTSDLVQTYDDILRNKDKVLPVIDTGYAYLNKLLNGGWGDGTLNVLAARTGIGKTALALNFAINAASKKCPVAFFSSEMSSHELMCRMISICSSIDSSKVQTYNFKTNEDLMRLQHALTKIKDLPIYIDDTANIRLVDLVSKARKLKSENPALSLIIVDYLQIVIPDSDKNDSQALKIGKIATALKGLARDLNIPIIALAQLNRAADKNAEGVKGKPSKVQKRPQLSDLKDSSQIEQDADLVLFLYKEDYYSGQDGSSIPDNEEVELIIGKNRHGQKTTVHFVSTPKFYQYKERLNQEQDKPDIGD